MSAATTLPLLDADTDSVYRLERSLAALRNWLEQRDFCGYEPFDILSSPFLRRRWLREWPLGIAFIQFGKRLAGIRLRRWLRVPVSKNPKALGLFLSAYCDLEPFDGDALPIAKYLKSELKRLRSPIETEYCWGYDWDHVSRSGSMPAFSPNCIATCFCAHALLDMAEVFGDSEAREMAESAGRFLVTRLNRPVNTPQHLCFSYTPRDQGKVFNASVIAGSLLARVAPGNEEYVETARRTMNYLIACQQPNGAWYYGASRMHRWIDGFHTAYNLGALLAYQRLTGDTQFAGGLRRGYEYYVSNLFRRDGAPKYFHNSVYPIDIHSCSQAILTFCDFADQDAEAIRRALNAALWTIDHMGGDDGTFFFQINRFWTNRAPYMRWGQAWMLHALARLKHKLPDTASTKTRTQNGCNPRKASFAGSPPTV